MLARIERVGLHRPTGLVYADVSFWPAGSAGGDPVLRNDFLVDCPATVRRIATDGAGRLITRSGRRVMPQVEVDGDWRSRPEDPADPWRWEPAPADRAAPLLAAVTAFARRWAGQVGDRRGVHPDDVAGAGAADDLTGLVGHVLTVD